MAYVTLSAEFIIKLLDEIEKSLATLSYNISNSIDHGSCDENAMDKFLELIALRDYFMGFDFSDYDADKAEELWHRAGEVGGFNYMDISSNVLGTPSVILDGGCSCNSGNLTELLSEIYAPLGHNHYIDLIGDGGDTMRQYTETALQLRGYGNIFVGTHDPAEPNELRFFVGMPEATGTFIAWGGELTWTGTGLIYDVAPAGYYINGTYFTYAGGQVTFTDGTGHAGQNRVDTVTFDIYGAAVIIEGVPDAVYPLRPTVDPITQVYNTHLNILSNQTVPVVTGDAIYDENLGIAGGEWDPSGLTPWSVAFNNAGPGGTPQSGSVAIAVSKPTIAYSNILGAFYFTHDVNIDLADIDALTFWIYIEPGVNIHRINILIYNLAGTLPAGTPNVQKGKFGFSETAGTWEKVTVPKSAWGEFSSTDVGLIYFAITANTQIAGANVYLDNINLTLAEINQPPPPAATFVSNTVFVDVIYGSDATGVREDFSRPFATAAAAQTVAQSGDTIEFRPGTHTFSSSLGKDGLTYEVTDGAILTTSSGNMFSDSGGNVSFDITGRGKFYLAGGSGKIGHFSGSGVINFDVKEIYSSADSWLIEYASGGSVSGTIRYQKLTHLYTGGTNNAFVNRGTGLMVVNFDYSDIGGTLGNGANIQFFGNRVDAVYSHVNAAVFSGHGVTGGIPIEATINQINISGTNGTLLRANGSTIILKGATVTSSLSLPTWPLVCGRKYNSIDGIIELQNCKIINTADNNKALVGRYSGGGGDANSQIKFIIKDCELVNEATGAAAHGMLLNSGNSGAGYATVEIKNTEIKLHSTAVAAGAKAIEAGGTALNTLLLTDVISNGAFDGTNLVTGTWAMVDPNCKSD